MMLSYDFLLRLAGPEQLVTKDCDSCGEIHAVGIPWRPTTEDRREAKERLERIVRECEAEHATHR